MSKFIRVSAAAALAAAPAEAAAHAFGARYDLPLPLPLWLAAAGLTVALSFVVFAVMLRQRTGALPPRLPLLRLPPLAVEAIRAVSVCVFFVLIAAGLFGTQDPFRNLAPAFVWIAWWIGFTYLSALAGDLWSLLNPWNALYLWAEALAHRIRPAAGFGLGLRLPGSVGAWPAAAMLLAFSWIEIVWEGNAVPANIAWLALGYSALTWTGMFVFGRETWLQSGEFFAVYFGWLARLAPSEVRTGNASACEWRLRPPAAGLLGRQPVSPSQAFFVIIMLAIVTFDGLRETPLWAVSDSLWTAAATAGLLALPWAFALVIAGTCAWMASLAHTDARPASAGELARWFVPALLPIAFVYHVAHYLSYLLVTGQVVIPLVSDPFGRGWDLFGTAHYRLAAGVVGARFAWYTSVVVIVAGHVLAMYVAHRLALERFSDPRTARRSQVPFAALMVAYTMLSLWILAQPIVEAGPATVK
ncbi:MAG: hypothetical protein HYX46_11990 [Betaproteobacteria bacterium]|nr:hypothetical protein [Betaproteobacteria bacterium]